MSSVQHSASSGHLYIVATPIGNLDDMVPRAIHTLQSADYIAAEDTRHSGKLLKHFAVQTPMLAYHEHNETERTAYLVELMLGGCEVALISDAGTPLISDPGFRLVRAAHEAGIPVTPVPGASAMVAALSVSGLPSDQVYFAGFLPHKAQARLSRLQQLAVRRETLVIYESCHRIAGALEDMVAAFGPDRQAAFCRELTKTFETVRLASLQALREWVAVDPDQQRGEMVIVIEGNSDTAETFDAQDERWLRALAAEMAPSRAAAIGARVTGMRKRQIYAWLADNLPQNQADAQQE
jgi:16S rRNA (cytidine1402-2'-O)-methyltransferase